MNNNEKIIWAAKNGHVDVVNTLLVYNANFYHTNKCFNVSK